jgi:protein gp37
LPSLDLTGIDWVIVGGESGPGARPMHPDWARDIRDRCVAAGVPFFFKQWGAWRSSLYADEMDREPDLWMHRDGRTATEAEALADGGSWTAMHRFSKKAAGRRLDGRTWDEMPARVGA